MSAKAFGAPASATASTADRSPLCQLEGGHAFAVDAGESVQTPDDPDVHPLLRAGEKAEITVIPCWTSDSAPDNYITSVTANLGDDNALVGRASGLHTVDPFTLDLNGAGSIPPAPTLAPFTVHAVDNHGVERWTATVFVKLITPCANDDDVVDIDTGTVHNGYYPQIESDAARISVIPCPNALAVSPDTSLASASAWIGGDAQVTLGHPMAQLDGLQATSPFTLDLHNDDGSAFLPGQQILYLKVTDNRGNVSWFSRQVWIVGPVSASWSAGTTLPDTPTTVQADLHNTSDSPVTAVSFTLVTTTLGAPQPARLSDDLSSATGTLTFAAGPDRVWARVTLANGITYPLPAFEVSSRYVVDTSVAAPADADWGQPTTFHATAVSSTGTAQRGLTLHLQSRAPGSKTWVERAAAVTNSHGKASLSIRATNTGTASWRVTSAESKKRRSSTSPSHVMRVHAIFGRHAANRSVKAGHAIRYQATIKPGSVRARVDAQMHRVGHAGWTTLGHTTSGSAITAITIRPPHAGQYKVRFVVESTKTLAQTVSGSWDLSVTQ